MMPASPPVAQQSGMRPMIVHLAPGGFDANRDTIMAMMTALGMGPMPRATLPASFAPAMSTDAMSEDNAEEGGVYDPAV
jgi:hypothetical protein